MGRSADAWGQQEDDDGLDDRMECDLYWQEMLTADPGFCEWLNFIESTAKENDYGDHSI